MYAAGFTQIDGLDGSEEMLAVSRSKAVYTNLFEAFVAIGKGQVDIPDNTYDALTICASMGVNMVPPEGIYEMHRLVKPGGYIINVLRQETVEKIEGFKDKVEAMMQQMEADGKWKLLSREVFPDYLVDQGGVVFTHQVC
ncbi:Williams-Beuren syndrome chromosomal region 27 protein [Elysia marginata]|uniref:Williams-Beuren syndrome chromosomal region 27 protein n=1 Tax=Elysia marginata TaxID=1093978 RepID=A0AAV4HJD7_9GAST|nr:Williams-Beuren syndrome chromosomal region 27 protein [Elysia marginata]